jgi:uncharacterized protein (DUF4415 family)
MSEEHIVRRKLSELRQGKTDWARVNAMTEEEIDAAARSDPDAQPTNEAFWEDAGLVFPSKKLVCIRIDQDVLDWFRSQGRGYQTRMNAVLRTYMEVHTRERPRP